MCKLLSCTPDELGYARRRNREGISFMERMIIHKLEQEAKAHKEAERKAKARRRH